MQGYGTGYGQGYGSTEGGMGAASSSYMQASLSGCASAFHRCSSMLGRVVLPTHARALGAQELAGDA